MILKPVLAASRQHLAAFGSRSRTHKMRRRPSPLRKSFWRFSLDTIFLLLRYPSAYPAISDLAPWRSLAARKFQSNAVAKRCHGLLRLLAAFAIRKHKCAFQEMISEISFLIGAFLLPILHKNASKTEDFVLFPLQNHNIYDKIVLSLVY